MNYSQNKPTNSEQGSIRIKDVARWLAKISATDGVVSVGERKLLAEFASEFNLDANTLYRMAHDQASKKLAQYKYYFSHLHANKQKGKTAPHKIIMLLSIIKLISAKRIVANRIEFTEELQRCFLSTWRQFVGESSIFRPAAVTPFWHLNSEPFWKLIPFVGGDDTIAKLQSGNPYSAKAMRESIRYAQIDQDLFLLLQNEADRNILRQTLIDNLDI